MFPLRPRWQVVGAAPVVVGSGYCEGEGMKTLCFVAALFFGVIAVASLFIAREHSLECSAMFTAWVAMFRTFE
jgi:hypothetical protein